jgi:hypothetical protein
MLLKKSKPVSENGFPKPKKAQCFKCREDFYIKFVIPQQNYSKKNSWEYWTGKKETKKICNSCLKKLYYDKPVYWKTITDLRKRNLLRNYVYEGNI